MCYLYDWRMILLQGGADLATGLAYIAIALTVLYIYRAGGLRTLTAAYPSLWRLGAVFVGLCGISHILAMIEIFSPVYWLSGAERLAMAGVSVAFARVLWRRKDELSLVGQILGESTRQLRNEKYRSNPLPPERLPK